MEAEAQLFDNVRQTMRGSPLLQNLSRILHILDHFNSSESKGVALVRFDACLVEDDREPVCSVTIEWYTKGTSPVVVGDGRGDV